MVRLRTAELPREAHAAAIHSFVLRQDGFELSIQFALCLLYASGRSMSSRRKKDVHN